MPGVVEDEELQQQYRHLIELSPNILVMFKEALLNPEDSDRKRVLHASIDLANQIRFKIQRMGRARELPMTLSPSALRRPGSGLRTSAGVDTSTVEQVVSTPTPSFTSSSSTSSVDVDSSDGRDSKGKEKDHEKPLSTSPFAPRAINDVIADVCVCVCVVCVCVCCVCHVDAMQRWTSIS
jgi:hypothetical protein